MAWRIVRTGRFNWRLELTGWLALAFFVALGMAVCLALAVDLGWLA